MPTLMLRAFCMFRLGTVHLNIHTGRWSNSHVLSRTCQYCRLVCGKLVVEDPYHVCIECPLYECMRVHTLNTLHAREFDFSSVPDLLRLCVSMLCASDPSHVRTVGRFLCDCMAARDVFCSQPNSPWLSTARATYINDCVRKAPLTCDTSLNFLRDISKCDTSICASLSAYLQRPPPVRKPHKQRCSCMEQYCWCGFHPDGFDRYAQIELDRAAAVATSSGS